MTKPELYRDDSRVRHMLDALEWIVKTVDGMGREQLCRHEGKTESILFDLMVLGEAANNISRDFAAMNPDVDWRGLAGLRHKIVHDYAGIDYDTIWDILQKDIPVAYGQIKALAETLPQEPSEPPSNIDEFL